MVGLFLYRIFLNFPRKSPLSIRSSGKLAMLTTSIPSFSWCTGSSLQPSSPIDISNWRAARCTSGFPHRYHWTCDFQFVCSPSVALSLVCCFSQKTESWSWAVSYTSVFMGVCVVCGEMQPDRNPAPRCKCVLTPSHLSKQFSQLQYDVWEQAGVGLLCRPVTEYERKSKRGKKKETQEMLQWAALHLWVVITNKLFPLFCVISPHPVIVQRVGFPKDYADPCTSQVLERHPQTPLGWRNHLCLFFAFESSEKNSTQAM